jgi:dipeptide/tripeptide permease
MGNAVGQSATYIGLTAVLEIYFTRFLFVCDHNAKDLATSSTNIYLALTQICAITAGFFADKLIGNFALQVIGNILSSLSLCVILLSSWQYTLEEPSCCHHDNSTTNVSLLLDQAPHDPCQVLKSHTVLENWNFHMWPNSNLVLALFGLVVFALSYGHVNTIQSVFVGNQFSDGPEQEKAKERSFSWFYLWLNVGSLLGEGGMPILRETIGFIYTLFVLTCISVVSTIWMWFGVCFYTVKKPECPKCTCHCCRPPAVSDIEEEKPLLSANEQGNWYRQSSGGKALLLFTAFKTVLPILGVFLPITVFWALMFQQNSTWVAQGIDLDCYIGPLEVPPG